MLYEQNKEKPIIELQDLSKIYSASGSVAVGLHKVNISFYQGEFVAITGSSGSGKSTLLNVMSCIDSYEEGELKLLGEETAYFSEADRAEYRKKYVAFIFQDYNIIDSYTVYQNVELALLSKYPDKKERKDRIMKLLDKVGLSAHAKHRATKLSGGQKQRVSIARALAKDAPILFADEPTGNLDSKTSAEILSLLRNLSKDKLVIVVTHSYDQIAEYATRKVRLADGDIVEDTVLDKRVRTPFKLIEDADNNKKVEAKSIATVAKNNILATPKRSIFSLTGLIVLSLMFIWVIIALLTLNYQGDFYNNYHKQDIQITRVPAVALDEEDIQEISNIEGVATVNYYYSSLNQVAYFTLNDEYFYENIRPKSTFNGTLFSGNLPEANDEIVITIPAKKKYTSMDLIDKTISLDIYGNISEFVIVGVIVDNSVSPIAILSDNKVFNSNSGIITHNSLVVSVRDTDDIENVRSALESLGYLTYYKYSGASNIGIERMLIIVFSIFAVLVMMFLFRAIQGSVKTVGESKKKDYNIMRTVGLSDNYIKTIYYVEMVFIALIAWIFTLILSFIGVLVYSLIVSPSIIYGFQLIGANIGKFAIISIIALAIILFVTISNATRFNKKFFKYTVKNSLLEG